MGLGRLVLLSYLLHRTKKMNDERSEVVNVPVFFNLKVACTGLYERTCCSFSNQESFVYVPRSVIGGGAEKVMPASLTTTPVAID